MFRIYLFSGKMPQALTWLLQSCFRGWCFTTRFDVASNKWSCLKNNNHTQIYNFSTGKATIIFQLWFTTQTTDLFHSCLHRRDESICICVLVQCSSIFRDVGGKYSPSSGKRLWMRLRTIFKDAWFLPLLEKTNAKTSLQRTEAGAAANTVKCTSIRKGKSKTIFCI